MVKENITVHKALSELKVLDKRINDKISQIVVCVTEKLVNIKYDNVKIFTFK